MNEMSRIPKEIQDDWESLVGRKGMTVLYLWVKKQMKTAQAELESGHTDTYDKVCKVRGKLESYKSLAVFLDHESQRAAKGDTPQKESK